MKHVDVDDHGDADVEDDVKKMMMDQVQLGKWMNDSDAGMDLIVMAVGIWHVVVVEMKKMAVGVEWME